MYDLDLACSSNWVLKGEGNANAVFGYLGTDRVLVGRVLRVRKLPAGAPSDQVSVRLTQEIWGPDTGDLNDVSQYFAPILGSKFLDTGIQVQLPLDLVTGLNSQLHAKQHSTQPTALLSTEGCILPDTTIFLEDILACDALANTASAAHKPLPSAHGNASQSGSLQLGLGQEGLGQIAQHQHASGHKKPAKQRHQEQELHPALCVEIKPKWGLLPSSPAIPAQNDIKKRVSRFQLHQQLKLAQGKTSSTSAYDPLDLFSMDPIRMQRALLALFATPQNNLKLFIDGQPCCTSNDLQSDPVAYAVDEVFGCGQGKQESGGQLRLLTTVIQEILLQEGVLQKLLSIQVLDVHDIEGIHPLYQHVMQQLRCEVDASAEPCSLAGHRFNTNADVQPRAANLLPHEMYVQSLLEKSWAEQMQLIREYLLATTAKDCSLMITLQTMSPNTLLCDSDSSGTCSQLDRCKDAVGMVHLASMDLLVKCKVAVVDLDVKPHAKIISHNLLDQHIMQHMGQ